MYRMMLKKCQQGIALLEVLLSLSIIAIILVMATRYFFLAVTHDRINITRQQVGSVLAGIVGWKGNAALYSSSLNISALYNGGFLDRTTNLVVSGVRPEATARLYDPWGQEIMLNGSATGGTLTVQLEKHSDCVALQNNYPKATCSSTGLFSLFVR